MLTCYVCGQTALHTSDSLVMSSSACSGLLTSIAMALQKACAATGHPLTIGQ